MRLNMAVKGRVVLSPIVAVWLSALAICASRAMVVPDEGSPVELFNPTFHRAYHYNNIYFMETDTITIAISYNGSTEIVKLLKPTMEVHPGSSADTCIYFSERDPSSSTLDVLPRQYTAEVQHMRTHLLDYTSNRKGECGNQVFRAFDIVKTKERQFIAVGIRDNAMCVMTYNNPTLEVWEKGILDPESSVLIPLPILRKMPLYRVASATLRDMAATTSGDPTIEVRYIDESGSRYIFEIFKNGFGMRPNSLKILPSLSVWSLDSQVDGINFVGGSNEEVTMTKDPNGDEGLNGYQVMKRHFYYSFIEAISMFEGSLAYSRCFIEKDKNVQFINDKQGAKWPRGLDRRDEYDSVQALEAYKHNGSYYYHIFDISTTETPDPNMLSVNPTVNYWSCKFNSIEEAHGTNWPSGYSGRPDCRDYSKPFEVNSAPIDVVYKPQCSRVYAFYQHMYQTEAASKYFTAQSPFTVVDWMQFPVNAILHQTDRLYLFAPGSRLLISKPISGCSFEQVSIESEHYQSDLVLMFAGKMGELEYRQKLPYYDSDRRRVTRNVWFPPLLDGREIDPELHLTENPKIPEPIEPSSTPAPTTIEIEPTATDVTTSPKPKNSTGSFLLIIIVIVIILFAIICCCLYYFFVASKERQPPRQQPRPIVRSTPDSLASKQPGSTLGAKSSVRSALSPSTITGAKSPMKPSPSPTLTIRSAEINQPSVRSTISKAPTSKASTTKSSPLTKSTRSKSPGVSPLRSPMSKSTKNRSPKSKSPKSKSPRKSPIKSSTKSPMSSMKKASGKSANV